MSLNALIRLPFNTLTFIKMKRHIKTIVKAILGLSAIIVALYIYRTQKSEIQYLQGEIYALHADVEQALSLCDKNETELYEHIENE